MVTLLAPPVAQAQTAQQVVQRARAAVVGISVTPAASGASQADAKPSRQRETADDTLASSTMVTTTGQSVGSGTLVSADGLIVTAASLFEQAGEILVTLDDGSSMPATLVGADSRTNIALLRIARSGLAFLKPATELSPATGARVLALGRTTLELDSFVTVTDGLISAAMPGSGNYAPVLQATTQTLPSMGGGPLLLESTGEFIGINTQRIVSRAGGYSMSFATPITIYPRIANDLLRVGWVERAVLGVSATAMTDEMSVTVGLPRREGVLLTTVRPNSAAERAGLERGDIVLTVNGRTIRAIGELFSSIDAAPVGTTHQITYFHRGKILTTQATSELAPRR